MLKSVIDPLLTSSARHIGAMLYVLRPRNEERQKIVAFVRKTQKTSKNAVCSQLGHYTV